MAILIIFAVIPTEALKNTSFCIGFLLTGRLCPGCGSTRALNNIMHLNFKTAFDYNPIMTALFFPIALFIVISDIVALIKRLKTNKMHLSFLEYLLLKGFRRN